MYQKYTQLGFIAHPKMASRSIGRALEQQIGATQVGSRHQVVQEAVRAIQNCGGSLACVIRNPFDVMVSWYFQNVYSNAVHIAKRGGITPFENWIPQVLYNGNDWIEHGLFYGAPHCDTVLRYERLLLDLDRWLASMRLGPIILPSVGISSGRKGRAFQEFYNEYTKNQVQEYFAEELDSYDYEFDKFGEYHLTPGGFYGRV